MLPQSVVIVFYTSRSQRPPQYVSLPGKTTTIQSGLQHLRLLEMSWGLEVDVQGGLSRHP